MSGQGLLKHESAFRCVFEHRWVKTGEKCSYIFLSSPLLPQQRQSPMKSVGKKPSNLATPDYKWKPSDGFFVLFLHNHSLAGRSKGAVMSHIGQSDCNTSVQLRCNLGSMSGLGLTVLVLQLLIQLKPLKKYLASFQLDRWDPSSHWSLVTGN